MSTGVFSLTISDILSTAVSLAIIYRVLLINAVCYFGPASSTGVSVISPPPTDCLICSYAPTGSDLYRVSAKKDAILFALLSMQAANACKF